MAVTAGITFRHLINQLDESQRKQFIVNLATSNPDLVITALFNHFTRRSTKSTDDSMRTNQTLSAIIESQENASDSTTETGSCTNLDTLPQSLIGHTASYLPEESYKNLSITNRTVYLGCNVPNTLREIDLSDRRFSRKRTKIKASFDLSHFTFTTKIAVSLHHRQPLIFAGAMRKMRHLQSLEIDGDLSRLRNTFCHEIIERVRYLKISLCSSRRCHSTVPAICRFKNVEFMDLDLIRDRDIYGNAGALLTKTFRNLKGLKVNTYDSGTAVPLLRASEGTLQYLHWWNKNNRTLNTVKDIDFSGLKQFRCGPFVYQNGHHILSIVLQTAKDLEMVSFDAEFSKSNAEEVWMAKEVIVQCKKLKYLEIPCCYSEDAELRDVIPEIAPILNAIKCGLSETKMVQRDSLRIKLEELCVL